MWTRVCGDEPRKTCVCIDSYDKCILQGRFYNIHCEGSTPFQSTVEFLSRMEEMLNGAAAPKAYTVSRDFGSRHPPPAECWQEADLLHGKRATFVIRIVFRQNTSWQGVVTWLEGNRSQCFRSVLELILLMDSALRSEGREEEVSSA